MPDPTPAQLLTAAADRLDALLADLNGAIAGQDYHWDCNRYVEGEEVNRYTSAMNPTVGRALAALLREVAKDATYDYLQPTSAALDVARALLREG